MLLTKRPLCFVLSVFLSFSTTQLFADRITYNYDDAGNRISRQKEIVIDTRFSITENPISEKSYEDSLSTAKIVIYPNPTYGQLRIDIIGCSSFEGSFISLLNLSGQQLKKWDELSESVTIDITEYKPATYLLKISVAESVSTWKIIKL